ncbi:(2Fe-2S) ferredoxin domain-containing protein [haloarchaeon 3A1-DGR]|nr:(2Fe-2S) ferredoxin domain-containing protein [haloarchaeon 3A1-DGR]
MRDRTDAVRDRGFTDHVLVCTHDRDSEYACCAGAGGEAVLDAVRTWLRERDLFWSGVYVAETSCLGLCSSDGAAVAIHPRGRWYADVAAADVPELLAREFGAQGNDENRTRTEADRS